jgi:hypothetical protein
LWNQLANGAVNKSSADIRWVSAAPGHPGARSANGFFRIRG